MNHRIERRAGVTRHAGIVFRPRPSVGMRPTVRFALAFAFTLAYVSLCVYVSQSWRADLEGAIGPVMSWVIPTMLAYIPGLLIGFLAFTLITTRYRLPDLEPPKGLAGRPMAVRDPDRGRLERGGHDRPDARAPCESLVPGPAANPAGGQQLLRPHRRARAGGGAPGSACTIAESSSPSLASTAR